jgi:hypothetical protein
MPPGGLDRINFRPILVLLKTRISHSDYATAKEDIGFDVNALLTMKNFTSWDVEVGGKVED